MRAKNKVALAVELSIYDCLTLSIEKDHLKSSSFALNCRLQKAHVNSDCAESSDGPLAIASRSLLFFLLHRFYLLKTLQLLC